MSVVFDENEKEIRQLVFRELDALKKKGDSALMQALYDGMALPCSHFSSSTLVSCCQIHRPKDHVHFEEYETIEEYLKVMTDVEYHWFARKETDCSKITQQAWEDHQFFNLKAAVHYKKFGDALLFKLCMVNPIMISGIMEEAYQRGDDALAFNILTSSQIECPIRSKKIFEFKTPMISYIPAITDSSLVEVGKTDTSVEKSINGQISSGVLTTGIDDVDFPESWVGKDLDFLNVQKAKGQIETKIVVDQKQDLVVVTPLSYPWDAQYDETASIREVLQKRHNIFGTKVKLATQGKEPVIAFSMEFDGEEIVCATPPLCVPSVSILRWLSNIEKYPPLQFCVPMAAEKVMNFKLGKTLVFSMDGDKTFLSPAFKNKVTYCDCVRKELGKNKNRFCREHGVTGTVKGSKASLFREPRPEDIFVFSSSAPGVFASCLLRIGTQELGPKFKSYSSRKDQRQIEYPYSWPVPSLLGSPPLGYLMRSYVVSIDFFFERNFVHVSNGKNRGKKNFIPIEVFLVYDRVPEISIGRLIITYIAWLEENLSFYDLGLLNGRVALDSRVESIQQRRLLLQCYNSCAKT